MEFKKGFYQWLQLVNNFHDLNDILAISWQFLAFFIVFFGCSFVFLAISWDIQGKFLPILPIYRSIIFYQQSYTKQSYFPKIFKMLILAFCLFIYLFNPASEASGVVLNLTGDLMNTFEGKMIKNDHF